MVSSNHTVRQHQKDHHPPRRTSMGADPDDFDISSHVRERTSMDIKDINLERI